MKICFITEYYNPDSSGGTPSMLPNLVNHLVLKFPEIAIDVFCSNNAYRDTGQTYPPLETRNGVCVHRINTPRSNDDSTAIRLLKGALFSFRASRYLRDRPGYDMVFLGTNPPAAPLIASLTPWMRKVPYAYLVHDLYPDILVRLGLFPENNPIPRIAGSFQRKWLQRAANVVAIGRCMREHIIEKYGVSPERVSVITNWADSNEVPNLPKESEFRKKHGIEGFVVLYSGNFGKHQDFRTVLDAAEILKRRKEEITFVLVGDGAKKDELIGIKNEKRLDNVCFFPFVPTSEYPDLLASADVSLVTLESAMEGVGVPSKFYNILASGRATLAILDSTSEVARVLIEHKCGVRVNRGMAQDIADEIIRLHDSPDEVKLMGDNARKALIERFTLETIAGQYYQMFHEITKSVKGV